MHIGINEAGAAAAFTATSTRRTPTHGEPLIPIYIFYSMFGYPAHRRRVLGRR